MRRDYSFCEIARRSSFCQLPHLLFLSDSIVQKAGTLVKSWLQRCAREAIRSALLISHLHAWVLRSLQSLQCTQSKAVGFFRPDLCVLTLLCLLTCQVIWIWYSDFLQQPSLKLKLLALESLLGTQCRPSLCTQEGYASFVLLQVLGKRCLRQDVTSP